MDLCDINQVKRLLGRYNFKFSKSMGQNFLCDPTVPRRIAQMCGADAQTGIIEVGPGIGALTCRLAEVAEKVAAVELDRALLPLLSETLREYTNIEIINGDILKYNIADIIREHLPQKRIIACANLPYYITSPVITALIESECFNSICVMVQREVAQRCCAAPATSDYGAFSLFIDYYTVPKILFDVPPDSFIPQPKVFSSVMRLDMRKEPRYTDIDKKDYFRVVRAAFAQRRKTLINSLSATLGAGYSKETLAKIVAACGLSPNVRGEQLSPDDFCRLTKEIYGKADAI